MLKKLVTALNPFHRKPAPVDTTPKDEPDHSHSFSCACEACVAETSRQTAERLRAQGHR